MSAKYEQWQAHYVNLKDAAEELGISDWAMRGLIKRTHTQTFRLPIDRRARFIRRSDMETLRDSLVEPIGA